MARRSDPKQAALSLRLDLDAQENEGTVSEASEPAPPRRGRPRIWASEAERKRAYRERLATDHAEPERLRRELRAERKRVAERDQKLIRTGQKLARAKAENRDLSARNGDLLATIETRDAQIEFWQDRARKLEDRLAQERERARVAVSKPAKQRPRSGRSRIDLRLPPPAVSPSAPPRPRRD
jgi:chromosome segregation ATPase